MITHAKKDHKNMFKFVEDMSRILFAFLWTVYIGHFNNLLVYPEVQQMQQMYKKKMLLALA